MQEWCEEIPCLRRYKFQFSVTQTIMLQALVICLRGPGRCFVPRYYLWEIKTDHGWGMLPVEPQVTLSHGLGWPQQLPLRVLLLGSWHCWIPSLIPSGPLPSGLLSMSQYYIAGKRLSKDRSQQPGLLTEEGKEGEEREGRKKGEGGEEKKRRKESKESSHPVTLDKSWHSLQVFSIGIGKMA